MTRVKEAAVTIRRANEAKNSAFCKDEDCKSLIFLLNAEPTTHNFAELDKLVQKVWDYLYKA